MKFKITTLLLFLITNIYAQKLEKEKEDYEYEIRNKSQPWFANMKDGANYFEVKKNYDLYFGDKQWEKSKPRTLGESWLKSKLYYLDANGFVQPEPKNVKVSTYNTPLNTSSSISSTTQIWSWDLLGPVNLSLIHI